MDSLSIVERESEAENRQDWRIAGGGAQESSARKKGHWFHGEEEDEGMKEEDWMDGGPEGSSVRKNGTRFHGEDEDEGVDEGDGGKRSSSQSSGSFNESVVERGSGWSHGDDIDAKKSSSATGGRESAGEKSQEEGEEGEGRDGWEEKCNGNATPSKLSSSFSKDSQPEIPSSPPGNESGQRESGRRSMTHWREGESGS